MSTDISHLRNLPVAEKPQIVEQLWDDIHESAKVAITLTSLK
jgi:hypothetical protein